MSEIEPEITELAKEWHAHILKQEENDVTSTLLMYGSGARAGAMPVQSCIKIKLPIETIDELPVTVEIVFKKIHLTSTKNMKKIDLNVFSDKNNTKFTDNICENHLYNFSIYCNKDYREFHMSRELAVWLNSSSRIWQHQSNPSWSGYRTSSDGPYCENWTISMLEASIISLRSCLNNLKFNCYGSRFDYNGYSNMGLLKNIFKGPNITHLDQACCVCRCDTMCKTKCGHNLCLRCWSKLKLEKICQGCNLCCGECDCCCGECEGDCVNAIHKGHRCPICHSFMKNL